jgi:hypothetical protein
MRRPSTAFLVVAHSVAEAVFTDRADARDFAAYLGSHAHIQLVPWWPAGVWRYGIATSPAGQLHPPQPTPPVPLAVLDALQRHLQISRRCAGAGIEKHHGPYRQIRYCCPRCRAVLAGR